MTPIYRETPAYEHDCPSCRFVAHVDGADVYWHPDRPAGGQWVARTSSRGPDYRSSFDDPLARLLPGRARPGLCSYPE